MTRLEELRQQAAAAIEAAKLKAADAKEELQLKMVIARTNDNAILARVRAEVKRATTDKLTLLNAACDSIVAEMPIFNSRTKENRKWNPSRQYGYGNQIAMVTGLLSGIQYSATDHKQQMLALTNLDDDLVEETIAAFGSAPYYSQNYHIVTAELPFNVQAILAGLDLVEERLDVALDKSAITETSMRANFNKARITAEKMMAEVEAALARPTITIE